MECPVCYCDDTKCHLVCGHSFCHGCVKEWWTKSEDRATCPMCRQAMYFRGMYKAIDKWEKERQDARNQVVYTRIFDDVMEDLDEGDMDEFDRSLAMFTLMNLDDVFKRVTDMGWDFDEDTMYDVVNEYMIHMRLDYEPITYDDVLPHERLLFVPKKPSAVARLRAYNAEREHRDAPLTNTTIYLTISV